ncbi:MAG: AAA family ATPase [Elusimicrobia bacterium]|nr:AAA family ATPase [Candidatus Liberimonas magnetica]
MKPSILKRSLIKPKYSFFLFGPRGVGKSTWLKQAFLNEKSIDLLNSELFLELTNNPHRLEAIVGNAKEGSWVVVDEIQKIPALLDEVHRLMEDKKWQFALCGSSARKLKRGGANLLAGRAVTLNMEGFSSFELGTKYNLSNAIQWGTIPFVHSNIENAPDILAAYLNNYIKEEITAEGLIRNIPPFIRFLTIAGQLNGQIINGHNISREAAVARATVDTYFSILVDTMMGHFLTAWRPGFKVREIMHPKFYWFDPGVARAAAGMLRDNCDRIWQGNALETLIYHELRVYNEVSRKHRPVYYYRTQSGVEIDFIIETAKRQQLKPPHIVALEVKLSNKFKPEWTKPLLSINSLEGLKCDRSIIVYTGERTYRFDKIEVYPAEVFLRMMNAGDIF